MHSFVLAAMMLFMMQAHRNGGLFPLPQMHEDWPSDGLTSHEQTLLRKAHSVVDSCEFDYAVAELGKLGKAVLTRDTNGCNCGATGNCAIDVFLWKGDRYREIPVERFGLSGWAWGVVRSDATVSYLAIGSNAGGGCQNLDLFRYADGKFVLQGREAIRRKNEESGDWWTPSQVIVQREC